ncbi:MAG TPA: trimeric intracellular cation channel family protein [Jatrophihabitans sp.]|nr:trimeric intracellular cation channel family protein [Jatrophihabitans sp.]
MTESSTQLVLDLIGVFVFALSGALAAVRARLDLFGVLVVGSVTALGGGVLRDTLIAANPPYAFRHPAYLITPALAAAIAFVWHPQVARLRKPVLVLDAAGLALFAVTGTQAPLRAGLGLAASTVIGVLTAIGGGLIRDILLRQIPVVLQRGEIYAVAALVGAGLVCLGNALHVLRAPWLVGTAVVVFLFRMLALRRHWTAPVPRNLEDQAGR